LVTQLLLSCGQRNERSISFSNQILKTNGIVNLCLKTSSYFADTLLLTKWDSLDKNACPSLIICKNNKLSSCLPDEFRGRQMGIHPESSWNVNLKTGIITLDVIESGIDDKSHYKAEFVIINYNQDTLELVRIKTIIKD
jgi:hypothetical protein